MPNAPTYRLYLDESGDHTFKNLDDHGHRFLALLGVWFHREQGYIDFSDRLAALKREVFGPRPDNPVILHRSEVINRKGPFGVLNQREMRERFDEGLLDLLENSEYLICCTTIDKLAHKEKYDVPIHPYHYCLKAILERYCRWLLGRGEMGDVMAESRGGREDRKLKSVYRDFFESGSRYLDSEQVQKALTSKKLKLNPKERNIPGLQLADLLANPVRKFSLIRQGFEDEWKGDAFGERIVEVCYDKFRCSPDEGKLEGWGLKWLP